MSTPMISVVVCTYNRAELLKKAVQSLCQQSMDPQKYEVIVVDNNSTDNTRKMMHGFTARYSNVRYVLELKQGVSHARNRGWHEASAEYIGYCDDDCELPPEWLSTAQEIVEKFAPQTFGGPYYATYDSQKPHWFKDSYGSRDFGPQARALRENEFLIGCNVFFHRSIFENCGGFEPDFGMNGEKVGYGEENELQKRIRQVFGQDAIYSDPRLFVYHLVRREQMTLRWITRAFVARGRYRALISQENHRSGKPKLLLETARTLAALSVDLARAAIKRDRSTYRHMQNYYYEYSSRYVVRLGRLFQLYSQADKVDHKR